MNGRISKHTRRENANHSLHLDAPPERIKKIGHFPINIGYLPAWRETASAMAATPRRMRFSKNPQFYQEHSLIEIGHEGNRGVPWVFHPIGCMRNQGDGLP